MDHRIDVFEIKNRKRVLVRTIDWHPYLLCWVIHFPPTRQLGQRVEQLKGGRFETSRGAMWAFRTGYPARIFDPVKVDLPLKPLEPTVARHEPGNTLPGGNGTWVRVGSRSDYKGAAPPLAATGVRGFRASFGDEPT